jgi:hypothetical protein
VLVDHADPGGDGVRRGVEVDELAVDRDGALVGTLHPVEDLHQGRLARAVLTHQGVHGAAADSDVDVGVRYHAGEPLGDALQFHSKLGWLDYSRVLADRAHSLRTVMDP